MLFLTLMFMCGSCLAIYPAIQGIIQENKTNT